MPHDEIAIAKLLQTRGLRVTRQRLAILDAVCDGRGHTTMPAILKRVREADPSIDQSTVHRTMKLLCDLGAVAASAVGGETVYEIVAGEPHHHLRCSVCGRETDVPTVTVQALFDELRRRLGFTVATRHLILDGVCAPCTTAAGDE